MITKWLCGVPSEHVVAGVRLVGHRARLGRDAPEAAGLVVLERRDEFVPGVHHEGPIGGDGLPDRLPAEQEHVELLAQGAGRLLRTTDDKGMVAVLDPRLVTARYGGFLRASLPPFWTTTDPGIARAALRRLAAGAG